MASLPPQHMALLISLQQEVHIEYEPPMLHQSLYYELDRSLNLPEEQLSGLKIFNNNARSLPSNYNQYCTLFTHLAYTSSITFDIITETWLDDSLTNTFQFEGYSSLYKHKTPDKRGSGIAIFVKNTLKCKTRPDLHLTLNRYLEFDCLFIELLPDTTFHSPALILGVLYRSPSHNNISNINQELSVIIDQIN